MIRSGTMGKSRTAALLAQMAATTRRIDGMIAAAKGTAPAVTPKAPKAPESGNRAYVVSDWRLTCSKCPKNGKCDEMRHECGRASGFPIFHRVSMTLVNGTVVSTVCREGAKGDGGPCLDGKCRHVTRALEAMAGGESRGVELSAVFGTTNAALRCPNCRQVWGVTAKGDGEYECRNPVCARDGIPWVFRDGMTKRPKPMRHSLVIMDRDPGRVVVKR
jgi:hypothetical protein